VFDAYALGSQRFLDGFERAGTFQNYLLHDCHLGEQQSFQAERPDHDCRYRSAV